MVRMEIRAFDQKEWDKIVSGFRDLSLMQTWEFGEAKARTGPWKISRMIFWEGTEIIGAVQAMVRTIPLINRGFVWINRAPLWENKNPAELRFYIDMLCEIKRFWVDQKKMYLRIAPSLMKGFDSDILFENAGFSQSKDKSGWASEVLDLSFSEDEIRKGLKQKWRNCLNKSERMGISYIKGSSEDLIARLSSDYREILSNKGFETSVTPELIEAIYYLLLDKQRMAVFTAYRGKERLGSILIVCYGNTCMYLVGAINEIGKKLNVNYYLIWKVICEMKKEGYRWFDVGGADKKKTPQGILHFKQGLGGKDYQLMGEWEAYRPNLVSRLIKWYIKIRKQ